VRVGTVPIDHGDDCDYRHHMPRMIDILRTVLLASLLVVTPWRAYAQPVMPEADKGSAVMPLSGQLPSHVPCLSHDMGADGCQQHPHGHAPHCSGCLHVTLSALPTSALLSLPHAVAVLAMEPTTQFSSPLLPLPPRPPQAI